jgi:hypothetical protein
MRKGQLWDGVIAAAVKRTRMALPLAKIESIEFFLCFEYCGKY